MLAASLYFLYSSSCSTSWCRGSSSGSSSSSLCGSTTARLDLYQRAGHFQEVAHRVDVQRPQDLQVLQVLLRDQGNRQVEDLHLVFPHEVQQQVQGTAIGLEIHVKIHSDLLLPDHGVSAAGRVLTSDGCRSIPQSGTDSWQVCAGRWNLSGAVCPSQSRQWWGPRVIIVTTAPVSGLIVVASRPECR